MVEGNERSAIPLRLHNVLLALAGRLDDSALGQARRLAARARADEAAELITGSLVAGRIPVRATEQRELAALLAAAGADDWFAEQLLVDDVLAPVEHRFSGGGTVGSGIADVLEPVLRRLPDVRAVYAVWRNTVAGSVPGPMPQRLVLAEVGPDGSALATAYRMDTALRRAGISAAVEAVVAGSRHEAYHRDALAMADQIAGARDRYEPPAPEPVPEPAPEPPVAREPEPEPTPPAPPVEPPPAPPTPPPPPVAVAPVVPVTEPVPVVEPEPERQEPARAIRAVQAVQASEQESYPERPWAAEMPPIDQQPSELEPGELFWPQDPSRQPDAVVQAVPEEARVEQTTEMTASELGLLRSAIAANGKANGVPIAQEPAAEEQPLAPEQPSAADIVDPVELARATMEFPSDDLDNPRLSVRDRELLRELHAELAKREREQASQVRLNGWEPGAAR